VRVLLLYCHPRPQSFVGALYADAVETLLEAGHEVDVLDLYADNFDPVLRADEVDAFQYAAGHGARLRAAEALVAIYPTWWYGLPALLKGYFDRMWAPGVAFELADGDTKGLLHNIRRLVVITTYGAPRDFIEREIGDPAHAFWCKGIARLLAPELQLTWRALHGMDLAGDATRQEFRDDVRSALRSLS